MPDQSMECSGDAAACRYFLEDRCTLSENCGNNPPERDVQCPLLLDFMHAWDAFLDRAEVFNLKDQQAEDIWEKMAVKKLSLQRSCPRWGDAHHEAGCNRGFTDCPFLIHGVCLAVCPRCAGPCRFFSPLVRRL